MTLFALIVFFASLVAIVCLFSLRSWEAARGARFLPLARARADEQARRLKSIIFASRSELSKLPPQMLYITRTLAHKGALGLAALARALERGAHRLADLVSYKHRFEHRESTNEFLKQVTDFRNGNGHNRDETREL